MDYAVKYYKIVNVASEIADIFSLLEKGRRTPWWRGCQGEESDLEAWLPPRVIADIFSVLEKGRRTPWRRGCQGEEFALEAWLPPRILLSSCRGAFLASRKGDENALEAWLPSGGVRLGGLAAKGRSTTWRLGCHRGSP